MDANMVSDSLFTLTKNDHITAPVTAPETGDQWPLRRQTSDRSGNRWPVIALDTEDQWPIQIQVTSDRSEHRRPVTDPDTGDQWSLWTQKTSDRSRNRWPVIALNTEDQWPIQKQVTSDRSGQLLILSRTYPCWCDPETISVPCGWDYVYVVPATTRHLACGVYVRIHHTPITGQVLNTGLWI